MDNVERHACFTTHRNNLASLATAGAVHSFGTRPANLVMQDIGDRSINNSRARVMIPFRPPCPLSSCVRLTFSPKTPVALNIATGFRRVERVPNADLVILKLISNSQADHQSVRLPSRS